MVSSELIGEENDSEREQNIDLENIVDLPQNWQEALNLIESVSAEIGIAYAIIGSLGVAISCGVSWQPMDEDRKIDLDVYVMGNEEQRNLFHQKISLGLKDDMPLIDSKMLFGAHVVFADNVPFVEYKNLHLKIDPKVFEPLVFKIGQLDIPTLHPLTYLALLSVYNRKYSPKMQKRVKDLSSAIKEKNLMTQKINKNDLTPLLALQKRFELEHFLKRIRKIAVELKSNKNAGNFIKIIQTNFPKIWEKLHDLTKK
jgi:hypothetical protein